MTTEEQLYLEIGKNIEGVEKSQMFGKPCLKINGKAFASFYNLCMVFKLTGENHKKALELEGAFLFDPSGKGRAMKEWVQVPFEHKEEWEELAISACNYVKTTL